MRNVSEKTLKTMVVNMKCVGFFGKCIKSFTRAERNNAIDLLIERGWITPRMTLTPLGDEIAKRNLDLFQY